MRVHDQCFTSEVRFPMDTSVIYKLGSMKFTTHNDLDEKYSSKRVVI